MLLILSAALVLQGTVPDAVFLRRAYLDAIGTLPTIGETRAFLNDQTPDKRKRLIDRLLEREEYADYWALKWSDLLRVKSEFPINLWPNAVQAYHGWIRESMRTNKRYDVFARELLTSSGSNFREPPVNFYRAVQSREPKALASAVALTFMGTRTDRWSPAQLEGMATFFGDVAYKTTAEWKEEIVYFDPTKRTGPVQALLPDGSKVTLPPDVDPRRVFADWLISPKNPWFARAIVNRASAWLVGRGIIHEPDDIRPDNPPSNPQRLATLERQFIASGYDIKALFRTILNSPEYQGSAYVMRPLDAEVLIDAINQITGGSEQYSSAIPEPFTFVPEERRSIALADGSITSPFLKTFGRPSRDVGLESERNHQPSAEERLALLNSSHVQSKIEQSRRLQDLMRRSNAPRQIVNNLYLTILSRLPAENELQIALGVFEQNKDRRGALVDLAWALINTPEFLYRH